VQEKVPTPTRLAFFCRSPSSTLLSKLGYITSPNWGIANYHTHKSRSQNQCPHPVESDVERPYSTNRFDVVTGTPVLSLPAICCFYSCTEYFPNLTILVLQAQIWLKIKSVYKKKWKLKSNIIV